jgi:hypothetical protein
MPSCQEELAARAGTVQHPDEERIAGRSEIGAYLGPYREAADTNFGSALTIYRLT